MLLNVMSRLRLRVAIGSVRMHRVYVYKFYYKNMYLGFFSQINVTISTWIIKVTIVAIK